MIVIAIIGILFIVLVSRVDFATDKAKITGVQTDFRAFQVALNTVAQENAGFNTFGWDTGDENGDGIRNSYDKGDNGAGGGIAQNGIQDGSEVFVGSKVYGETWKDIWTLVKPGTSEYDQSALIALEVAINKNLDPKLHITIATDGKITMANQARDPWKNEYHGVYISNAERDNGADRGAIIMYSNGPNGKFGSEHDITNGVVSVWVPGNNIDGKDDMSITSCYSYFNGFGEVVNSTFGFGNDILTNGPGNGDNITPDPDTPSGGEDDNENLTQDIPMHNFDEIEYGKGYTFLSDYDELTLLQMILKSTVQYETGYNLFYDNVTGTEMYLYSSDSGECCIVFCHYNDAGVRTLLTCYIRNSEFTSYKLGCWYNNDSIVSDLSKYPITLPDRDIDDDTAKILERIFNVSSVSPSNTYYVCNSYDALDIQTLGVYSVDLVTNENFVIYADYYPGEAYLTCQHNDGTCLVYAYNPSSTSYFDPGWNDATDFDNIISINNIEDYQITFSENTTFYTPSSSDIMPLFEECVQHKFSYKIVSDRLLNKPGTCKNGPKYYLLCDYCLKIGTYTFESEVVDSHNFGTKTLVSNATCIQPGMTNMQCTDCGLTLSAQSERLGHNFVNGVCTRCNITIAPGLYASGTLEQLRKGKIDYATPIYTWEELTGDDLLNGGVIIVDNYAVGVNTSHISGDWNTQYNALNEYLTGDLILPSNGSITSIADSGFERIKISDIYIPECITTLGSNAFHASKLQHIYLHDGITTLPYGVFWDCTEVKTINLGEGINFVDTAAFDAMNWYFYTRPLISIVFENNFSFGGMAMYRAKGIGAITLLADSVISFDSVYYEQFFAILYVPKDLYEQYCDAAKSWGHFNGVSSIAGVDVIDNKYIAIKQDSYTSSSNSCMGNAVIPENTIYIDGRAFTNGLNNYNFTTITLYAEHPPTLENAEEMERVETIYVPADSVELYKNADGWSSLADKIVAIP